MTASLLLPSPEQRPGAMSFARANILRKICKKHVNCQNPTCYTTPQWGLVGKNEDSLQATVRTFTQKEEIGITCGIPRNKGKNCMLVRVTFPAWEPSKVSCLNFSMRPKLRIYLSGACENPSHRFAPKTAPKKVWDGSAPCSTLLYTWDKTHSEPWYAIPPNPTKHHCNARFLDFS